MDYMVDTLSAHDAYMREFGDHTLLKAEEEQRLISSAQSGDSAARDQLILHSQRLVIKVASRYLSIAGDQELTDLIQWGNIGLMTAIRRFDLSRNTRFCTYAIWWIRSSIRRNALDFGHTIRATSRDQEAFLRMNRVDSNLNQTLGHKPTATEIADNMRMPVEQVLNLKNQIGVYSLEDAFGRLTPNNMDFENAKSDWEEIFEVSPIDDPIEDQVDDRLRDQLIHNALEELSARYQEVLKRRYCCEAPETLAEIGKSWGVSRERVRQIEQDAKIALRKALTLSGVMH